MYQHIMVPLDGSELAECVLPHLKAIASGIGVTKITLARVVEPLHLYGGLESSLNPKDRQRLEADSMDLARSYLKQTVKQLKGKGITAQAEVLHGHVVDKLVDYANTNEVDLIIIASHGRSGVSRWVWGSVADRILRCSIIPVLIVRAPGCVPGV